MGKGRIMDNEIQETQQTQMQQGEIILYQPDETIRLEVRVEDETVWLTQQQISSLFLRERSVISRHINNVFKEGECDKESNVHFLHNANSDKPVMPPVEGIFYDGQIFDAYAQIIGLIKQAKNSIALIDNYIDETTLTMLSKRDASVTATIYTRPLSQQQQLDLQRHNQQYAPITVNICQHNHDRFLIIDDEVYVFGASLKDAGKKLFAYIKMKETSASNLINGIR